MIPLCLIMTDRDCISLYGMDSRVSRLGMTLDGDSVRLRTVTRIVTRKFAPSLDRMPWGKLDRERLWWERGTDVRNKKIPG